MRTDALRFLRSLDTCDWPQEQDKTVPLNSVIFWPAPRPGVFQQISMFIIIVTRVPESTGWNAAPDHHRASLTIHWRIAKVLLNFSFITKDHFDTVLLTWGSIFHLCLYSFFKFTVLVKNVKTLMGQFFNPQWEWVVSRPFLKNSWTEGDFVSSGKNRLKC